MEREAKTSIVLLDACRDNPLARNLARNMGTRSAQIGQGLAEVKTGVGTLIGYSTQPGNVALDGADRNSPYAEALLRHIEVPGRDISGVLIAVRNDVLKATDGKQVPWEHTSLTGQVYLKADAPLTSSPGMQMPSYDRELEISFWNSVKDFEVAGDHRDLPAALSAGDVRGPCPRADPGHGPGRGAAAGGGCDAGAAAAGRDAGPCAVAADRVAAGGLLSGSCRWDLGRPNEGVAGAVREPHDDEPVDRCAVPGGARCRKGAAGARLPARVRRRHGGDERQVRRPAGQRDRAVPKAAEGSKRAPGKDANDKGMCWARDGRVTIIVPCSDPRSFTKAY